ncbi:spore coat U domain-containing protein [Buttiauxella gaviniae]|uniref:Spore coat U domain-containing protein n=1 Tax=Buttiauxella gaviniae TaxID=82990 RepID=A0ABV3NYK2_9ENTR
MHKIHVWLWGVLVALPAGAVTQQSFQVGATITPGCSVASGSGGNFGSLNFGSHSGVENTVVSNAFIPNTSLALACTPGVALNMTVDGGKHYASGRKMVRNGGSDAVPYRLYTSGALTANTEIMVNQAVAITYSNSNNITLPIYGAAQLTGFSPAGTYTDQLTVTLSW